MTIGVSKFTPEVLLSAPRRSSAVPNADGTLAVYTVSAYSFDSHEKTNEIRVLNIENGQSTLITNEEKTSEPNWLGKSNDILWLKEGEKGVTHLIVGDANQIGNAYTAGIVPGPISNVKLHASEEGQIMIAFVGKVKADGSLFNPEALPKKHSTGLVYDTLMVRHWDKYVSPNRNSIWHGLLRRSEVQFELLGLTNALNGTNLECPIPPFGGTNDFDISNLGIVFVAKDPSLNPATNTKSNLYYLPLPTSSSSEEAREARKISVKGLEGASSSPVIHPNAKAAAFLQMRENGYESDKNRIILVPNLSKPSEATEILKSNDEKGAWDRSPSKLAWSNDGKSLFIQAEDRGKGLLFRIDIPNMASADITSLPEKITTNGYISDIHPAGNNSSQLFITSTNFVDNSLYAIIDPSEPKNVRRVSSNSRDGLSFGLTTNQVSDIWFKGAGDYNVHAWVVKPSSFKETGKYPLAYLIHGGPQGAWGDRWSTRWNPAVFAEQGYVVIAPNPTGSTGYGQDFCDSIRNSWGGLPYEDLVSGFEYIKENLSYVDTERAVALGASYGGYMMNWIQGNALGRRFRALVCHDGIFSMRNQISSDEQYFPNHDLGGTFWTAQENWDRWDPAELTGNWSTPQLVIHNELDYRLPISEGLAAFNVLQERGVESRFLTFPDENHWVLKEENSLVWHTVVLNWINHYAGLPPYKEQGQEGFEIQSIPMMAKS